MDRSTYPDGVVVDTTVLAYTELSKANEILRGRVDWTSRGVFSGGTITVGAVDNTRVDIAAFSGFAPNGEYVECTGNLASIQLDDSTLGAVNYVVAFYTESETRNQPHETDGETYPTRATGSYRVRVYEETAYLALPATDANLANDARDRALLLGKVTGGGAGVALTSSNIESPTAYNDLLYSDPSELNTITGVAITGVSSDTVTGAGQIDYTYAVGPVYGLTWTSAGGGPGAVVNPTVDGSYTLTDGTGAYIVVDVVISMLPLTTPLSEAVTVYDLYDQDIPRQTAQDFAHRNMLGSGVLSPQNCHALAYEDIGGSNLDLNEHQDRMHANGIPIDSSAATFTASITSPVTADLLTLVGVAPGSAFYVNGIKQTTLSPVTWEFLPASVPSSAGGCHYYEVYSDDEGVSHVHLKSSFPSPRTISGVWISDMSESYPASAPGLALTVTNPGTLTYAFQLDSGPIVTVTAAMENQTIRLYDATATRWIELSVNLNDATLSADGMLPGVGVYNDALTVYDSPDWEENIPILGLTGWYNNILPPRFQIGRFPYTVGSRETKDKRIWGNLAADQLTTQALRDISYDALDEFQYSGILFGRGTVAEDFQIYGAAALNISLRGGTIVCRGKRTEFDGIVGLSLTDNTTNLVYIDETGTAGILDVVADYAGSVEDALAYLIGGSRLLSDEAVDQYPERGVALYRITTLAGAITDTLNISRNVNGPVEPWSVSSFSGRTDDEPLESAFDNIVAAFYYAATDVSMLSSIGRSVTVKLTGPSTLSEAVTQPQNVNVLGDKTYSTVTIDHIDATGTWTLSAGCKLEGVYIIMNADVGAAVEPASDCTISRCRYVTSTANSDVFLRSSSALSNLVIEGCEVTTRSAFVAFTSLTNDGIWIKDSTVTGQPNNSSLNYGLINVRGKNIHVLDNEITTSNATDLTPAIKFATSVYGGHAHNNVILLGDGAGVAAEVGIEIGGSSTNLSIKDNRITRASGEISELGIGILVGAAEDVLISGNTCISLGVGVYGEAGAYKNTRVVDNNIDSCYHRGISFDLPTSFSLYGLTIDRNHVHEMIKGTAIAGTALWGIDLYGIRVYVTPGGNTTAEGVSISENELYSLVNAAESTYGIVYQHVAGGGFTNNLYNLKMDGNQVSLFLGNDTKTTIGIFQNVTNMDFSWGASVSNNNVATQSNIDTGTVQGIYAQLEGCRVVNNTTRIDGTTTAKLGDGIVVDIDNGIISDNTVVANWIGIWLTGTDVVCSKNNVTTNGIGILSTYTATISNNIIDVTSLNAVTNITQPTAACGCIVSDGTDCIIADNNLVLSGDSGGDIPKSSAHVYTTGSGTKIQSNSTRIGSAVAKVSGGAPSLISYVCHIYVAVEGTFTASISDNHINNFTNGLVFHGIYIHEISNTEDAFVTVQNNFVRGSSDSGGVLVPMAIFAAPVEYLNSMTVGGAGTNHRFTMVTGNVITSEALSTFGGNCPSIYYTAVQYPAAATTNNNNFATNYSPANYWP